MVLEVKVNNGTGETITTILAPDKVFSSGKKGFWGQQKFATKDGKTYQAQIQVVEIVK